MTTNTLKTPRIELVDALRGFAILSILLLHNLEHFDFYYFPETLPQWMKDLDGKIWSTMFFLFSGKAYAIFALLFGFTFYIQLSNREKSGKDFRPRFLWRLFLLFLFGIFNSIFFEGDILAFYAVLGVTLIPLCKWSNRAVLITAVILMLQPYEWGKYFYMMAHPDYAPVRMSDQYFGRAFAYLSGSSFWNQAIGNLWNGRIGVTIWSWENGRVFQTPALFMIGMLLGRTGLFLDTDENIKFWKKVLFASVVGFAVLFVFRAFIPKIITQQTLIGQMWMIVTSWSNFAFTMLLVSLFILLYRLKSVSKVLGKLIPLGRMTLSNYIIQSFIGSLIYYGFALGLYKYTGATYCLLIGIVMLIFQLYFCRWWLKHHKQGPMEYLWHKWTWVSFGENKGGL